MLAQRRKTGRARWSVNRLDFGFLLGCDVAIMQLVGRCALLGGVALLVGCTDGTPIRAARSEISELTKQVEMLQIELKTMNSKIDALQRTALTRDSTEASGCVTISADIYQNLGKLWQVTGLRLLNHAQGAELRGRVLSRLFLHRDNVSVSASLFGDPAVGSGVIRSIVPGRYSEFSIVINTQTNLKRVSMVCVTIHEDTGTTRAIE